MMRFLLLTLCMGCAGHKVKNPYITTSELSRVEGTGMEARDIQQVAEEMANSLLGARVLREHRDPVRILVKPMRNATRFRFDTETINNLVETKLVERGSGQLTILDRALWDDAERETDMAIQHMTERRGPLAPAAGAEYFLHSEIRSVTASSGAHTTDYTQIVFNLVTSDTLERVWSGSWEVKKQASWDVLYQ